MIKTLYNDRDAVLAWLRSMPKSVKQWLGESYVTEVKTLRDASDTMYVYRSQGRLQIIDRFMTLERELSEQPKG